MTVAIIVAAGAVVALNIWAMDWLYERGYRQGYRVGYHAGHRRAYLDMLVEIQKLHDSSPPLYEADIFRFAADVEQALRDGRLK